MNQEAPGGYVCRPAEWIWIPGVINALSKLAKHGILISIATNQSCIGRRIIDEEQLHLIHKQVIRDATQKGVKFNGIYYCPHSPEEGCACRKPKHGLLDAAIRYSLIPRDQTVFIGDSLRDLQAGQSAGIRAWLVLTGKGLETRNVLQVQTFKDVDLEHVLIFKNLLEASEYIVRLKVKG